MPSKAGVLSNKSAAGRARRFVQNQLESKDGSEKMKRWCFGRFVEDGIKVIGEITSTCEVGDVISMKFRAARYPAVVLYIHEQKQNCEEMKKLTSGFEYAMFEETFNKCKEALQNKDLKRDADVDLAPEKKDGEMALLEPASDKEVEQESPNEANAATDMAAAADEEPAAAADEKPAASADEEVVAPADELDASADEEVVAPADELDASANEEVVATTDIEAAAPADELAASADEEVVAPADELDASANEEVVATTDIEAAAPADELAASADEEVAAIDKVELTASMMNEDLPSEKPGSCIAEVEISEDKSMKTVHESVDVEMEDATDTAVGSHPLVGESDGEEQELSDENKVESAEKGCDKQVKLILDSMSALFTRDLEADDIEYIDSAILKQKGLDAGELWLGIDDHQDEEDELSDYDEEDYVEDLDYVEDGIQDNDMVDEMHLAMITMSEAMQSINSEENREGWHANADDSDDAESSDSGNNSEDHERDSLNMDAYICMENLELYDGPVRVLTMKDQRKSSKIGKRCRMDPKKQTQKKKLSRPSKCLFCNEWIRNLGSHIKNTHSSEDHPLLKSWMNEKIQKKKAHFLKLITNEGNFLHNQKCRSTKRGLIIPTKITAKTYEVANYITCHSCKGELCKVNWSRHVLICSKNQCTLQENELRLSSFMPQNELDLYSEYVTQTVLTMAKKERRDFILSDETCFRVLVNTAHKRPPGIKRDNLERHMANLMANFIEHENSEYNLGVRNYREFFLKISVQQLAEHSDSFNDAAQRRPREGEAEGAVKGIQRLKDLSPLLFGLLTNILEREEELHARGVSNEVELKVFRMIREVGFGGSTWKSVVFGAMQVWQRQMTKKKKSVPSVEDVRKLTEHLRKARELAILAIGEVLNGKSQRDLGLLFDELQDATACSITHGTIKRPQEVYAVRFDDYMAAVEGKKHSETIFKTPSGKLSQLYSNCRQVRTEGKGGKGMSLVIFPKYYMALDLLIKLRPLVGISEDNPWLFVDRNNGGPRIKVYAAMYKYRHECGAAEPWLLTAQGRRRFGETGLAELELVGQRRTDMHGEAGHNVETFNRFYRCQNDLVAAEAAHVHEASAEGVRSQDNTMAGIIGDAILFGAPSRHAQQLKDIRTELSLESPPKAQPAGQGKRPSGGVSRPKGLDLGAAGGRGRGRGRGRPKKTAPDVQKDQVSSDEAGAPDEATKGNPKSRPVVSNKLKRARARVVEYMEDSTSDSD